MDRKSRCKSMRRGVLLWCGAHRGSRLAHAYYEPPTRGCRQRVLAAVDRSGHDWTAEETMYLC